MRTANRRLRGLFHPLTFGLAVGLYFFVASPSVAQPPQTLPQQPEFTAPPPVLFPSGIGLSYRPYSTAPVTTDPISRVPNFFGDFVARSSGAFINQPIILSGSGGTAQTLTFAANSSAFLGIFGPVTFFAPFSTIGAREPGIGGPGGPYPITTDVTGFGIRPYSTVILNQNLLLTVQVQAQFPGAIFVSGLGKDGRIFFEYLQITPGQAAQIVPGLVAFVDLSNPSGGGLVGRNRYFDDGSPIPRDRVFFDYNHVGAFQTLGSPIDINRYVLGVEKTFLNGWGSVEVRVPFAGTANSDQIGGQALSVNHMEFGNVGLLLKGTLFRNANWLVSAGMGVSMPTADDSRLLFGERSIIEIRNNAWLLQPILGAAWAPNDRFYAQTGVQFDFDPTGNPVYIRSPGGAFSQRGTLRDQTYLYASGAMGYWVYQSDTSYLSRVSLQGELHYNRTLGERDFVQTGSVIVADLNSNVDVLNASAGVNVVLGNRTDLSVAVSLPVAGERLYDWNLMARVNFRFGRSSR